MAKKAVIRSTRKIVYTLKARHIKEGYVESPFPTYRGRICINDICGTHVKADIVRGLYGSIKSDLEVTNLSKADLKPIIVTLKAITRMLEERV